MITEIRETIKVEIESDDIVQKDSRVIFYIDPCNKNKDYKVKVFLSKEDRCIGVINQENTKRFFSRIANCSNYHTKITDILTEEGKVFCIINVVFKDLLNVEEIQDSAKKIASVARTGASILGGVFRSFKEELATQAKQPKSKEKKEFQSKTQDEVLEDGFSDTSWFEDDDDPVLDMYDAYRELREFCPCGMPRYLCGVCRKQS